MDISGLQWDNFLHYILIYTPFVATMHSEINRVGQITAEELQKRRTVEFLTDTCEKVEAEVRARQLLIEEIILVERAVALLEFHDLAVQQTLRDLSHDRIPKE